MTKKLLEIRDLFSKTINDPAHLNAPSREIASTFLRSNRSKFPLTDWDEVTITGLVHIMGGLRKRRPPQVGSDGTKDLFSDFAIDPIVVVRSTEKGSVVENNKAVPSLTLAEAEDYLARHTKERVSNGKMIAEWRRLIKRVKPFMTKEGMTLEDGLKVAAAHDAAKKKKQHKEE